MQIRGLQMWERGLFWCGFVRSNFVKEVDLVDGVEEEPRP